MFFTEFFFHGKIATGWSLHGVFSLGIVHPTVFFLPQHRAQLYHICIGNSSLYIVISSLEAYTFLSAYRDEHRVKYRIVESLYRIPETNIAPEKLTFTLRNILPSTKWNLFCAATIKKWTGSLKECFNTGVKIVSVLTCSNYSGLHIEFCTFAN